MTAPSDRKDARLSASSRMCMILNGFDDFVFVNPSDTLKNGQSRVSLDVSRFMIPKPSIRSIYLEILSLERWTMMIRDAEITDARELLAVMAQIDSETAFMLFEEGELCASMVSTTPSFL